MQEMPTREGTMYPRIFLSLTLFLVFTAQANALNPIDTFITNHCENVCNGETNDCTTCYNAGVDLYDQSTPRSTWELHNNHGKFEFDF
jgi:hypothetical protein